MALDVLSFVLCFIAYLIIKTQSNMSNWGFPPSRGL